MGFRIVAVCLAWGCLLACDAQVDLGTNDAGPTNGSCRPPSGPGIVQDSTGDGGECTGDGIAPTTGVGPTMPSEAGSGNGFVDPTDCEVTCQGVAVNGCGDTGDAQGQCIALCAESPTTSQLECFTQSSCAAVLSGLQGKSMLCGIVGPADGGLPANLPDTGQGGPVVSPTDCAVTCQGIAVNGCGDEGDAQAQCIALCARSPTQGEMACFGDAPCSEVLAALASGGPICGIGGAPDGG